MLPLTGRLVRQARSTVNTSFLLFFIHLFLITTWEFNESGIAITLYFVACLTVHAVSYIDPIF